MANKIEKARKRFYEALEDFINDQTNATKLRKLIKKYKKLDKLRSKEEIG